MLICRDVASNPNGELSLENVLEIVSVEAFPGDAGPLCFVAFVRDLPDGPGQGAFVLRSGDGEPLGRLPLDVNVPQAYAGRQLALHVKLPSLVIEQGGWFEVGFEWAGTELAENRFAGGATG